MNIKEFQELMRELYYEKDRRRGVFKTYLWFIEELGELSEAIRRNDAYTIRSEIADVYAWLMSLANLLEVDVEKALSDKWGSGVCPRCGKKPCSCTES